MLLYITGQPVPEPRSPDRDSHSWTGSIQEQKQRATDRVIYCYQQAENSSRHGRHDSDPATVVHPASVDRHYENLRREMHSLFADHRLQYPDLTASVARHCPNFLWTDTADLCPTSECREAL